ncbi:tyrosine-type recombinase/integrase [Methylobacterium sp. R2-1]|uniref:tyrosine-type recombinase/integrase n=1 Tax=Methylobacterium sp. R2-1 TaxID=2587064 RepID=UPI00160EEF88|nr:site-specific integrase [Methylobacterium sp. R2-1]MBB2963366.1 integrase [Methylobacterium sp. R2-1]
MATVRQRKEPSKKTGKKAWYVDYVDQGGVRRQETPKSGLKRDAEALRIKIEAEVARGEHVPEACALTVKEVADLFMQDQQQRADDGRIGRGRLVNVDIHVRKTIVPVIGAIAVSKLRATDIERIYAEAVQAKTLSPRTARQRIGTLKMIQDFAVRRGYMKAKPVDQVLEDLRGVGVKPIRRLSRANVLRILEASKKRRRRCWPRSCAQASLMIHLAALAGLRFGEITGLKVENVDLEAGVLRIVNSMSRYDGHKGPKSEVGYRTFPISSPLAAVLRAWLAEWHVPNEAGLLITTKDGTPTKLQSFHEDHWKPLLHDLGLGNPGDEYHFHALRGFAVSMASRHVPITDLPRMFGHKHLDVTLQHYLHELMSDTDKADAVERMALEIVSQPAL